MSIVDIVAAVNSLIDNTVIDVNKRLHKTGKFKSKAFKRQRMREPGDNWYSVEAYIDDSFYGKSNYRMCKVMVIFYYSNPDVVYIDAEEITAELDEPTIMDHITSKFSLSEGDFEVKLADRMFDLCVLINEGIGKLNRD